MINQPVETNNFLENTQVDKIGVASLEDVKDTILYDKAKNILPEAKSIIVLALELFPETVKYLTSHAGMGELALRDLAKRNMELVSGLLDWETYKIVKGLHKIGFKGILLPADGAPYDGRFLESVISYKHAAQAAGFGVLGWHSMLLTPEYGARVRLSVVITDAPLKPTASEKTGTPCTKCGGACVKICPVKAIKKPRGSATYNIDKNACSSYYTASGGCSECLRVCPAEKITWQSIG